MQQGVHGRHRQDARVYWLVAANEFAPTRTRLYIITVLMEAKMTARFICPHCHSPLDPQTMDAASSDRARLRICPECDEPIVLAITALPAQLPASTRLAEAAAR